MLNSNCTAFLFVPCPIPDHPRCSPCPGTAQNGLSCAAHEPTKTQHYYPKPSPRPPLKISPSSTTTPHIRNPAQLPSHPAQPHRARREYQTAPAIRRQRRIHLNPLVPPHTGLRHKCTSGLGNLSGTVHVARRHGYRAGKVVLRPRRERAPSGPGAHQGGCHQGLPARMLADPRGSRGLGKHRGIRAPPLQRRAARLAPAASHCREGDVLPSELPQRG